ncbi:MAG TPA: alpha/beta hydrolase [Solirubrobacterales bacterium]|jgi:pimeloyl-ACP methyl ester carboxylesterase|nr:alpha/beta hydrolase [Solirubrobacterales bacterium]
MPRAEVTAGPVVYGDTGGEGPTIVVVPGLLMDGRQWRKVIAELESEFRCVTPTLPTGAHREPMRPDADLSLRGMGRIVTEFLAAADLRDVTLCFNDWCGAQVMIADRGMERVAKLVLVSCETEGNYPPGAAGFAAWLSAKLPGGYLATRRVLLSRRLRRLPFVFGQMTRRGVPDELMRSWMEPLKRREIRRDLRRYAGDAMRGKRDLAAATAALRSFEKPVLVVWDSEGKMMPNEAGRKLAAGFPNSRYVELPDCFTLIPEDQPEALAREIGQFARQ